MFYTGPFLFFERAIVEYTPVIFWAILCGLSFFVMAIALQRRVRQEEASKKAIEPKGRDEAGLLWWLVPLCMVCASVLSLLAPLVLALKAVEQKQIVIILGQMGFFAFCVGLGALLLWRKGLAVQGESLGGKR